MMRILVTGGNGQLGSELRVLSAHSSFTLLFFDLEDLDLTHKAETETFIGDWKPDLIINFAAYTAVDKAEQEKELAMKVNAEVPGLLAYLAKKTGSGLIHISTDYIFKGNSHRPYNESDPPDPQSIYALSKFLGEQEILKHNPPGVIIRTSWLYSVHGVNFVKTIRKKGAEMTELRVVDDQTGSPTYARDLAKVILRIIPEIRGMKSTEIYHYSNEGETNWYEFAKTIIEISGFSCMVVPIKTADLNLAAQRPFYSVMDTTKIREKFHPEIPHWRMSLEECLKRMVHDNK